MNGILGHYSETVRLYWAGDNLGPPSEEQQHGVSNVNTINGHFNSILYLRTSVGYT